MSGCGKFEGTQLRQVSKVAGTKVVEGIGRELGHYCQIMGLDRDL